MRTSSPNTPLIAAATVLAALCATSQANAQTVQLNNGFSPDPVTMRGIAGGPVEASTVADSCRGFIPARPQHQIVTTGLSQLRVFTMAANNADVTLAIVTPDRRVYCDDDSGGTMQAQLDVQLPAGTYNIYVGSYAEGQMAPYTLVLTSNRSLDPSNFNPSAVTIVQTNPNASNGNTSNNNLPRPNPNGNDGNTDSNNNNQPRRIDQAATLRPTGPAVRLRNGGTGRVRGRTGGNTEAVTLHAACTRGFINTEPSHLVTIERAGLPLQFRVTSASDTTLMIRAPNGQVLCDDDSGGGFNPMVQFPATLPGAYTVWVGTFRPGLRNLYQLNVTTSPR
jgi:hypothetical protein